MDHSRRPSPLLFAVLGTVVVLGFAVMTWRIWSNDLALQSRGQETTARVTEVTSGKIERVHVVFTTGDGREVEALVGQGDEAPGPRVRPGDEIPIVYDPRHPTADVRDTRAPENHTVGYLMLGATVMGAIGVPSAVVALVRARRRVSA